MKLPGLSSGFSRGPSGSSSKVAHTCREKKRSTTELDSTPPTQGRMSGCCGAEADVRLAIRTVVFLCLLVGAVSPAGAQTIFVSGRATIFSSISDEFPEGFPLRIYGNWVVKEGQQRYAWSDALNFFYYAGNLTARKEDLGEAFCISPFCGIVLDDGVVAGVIGQIIIPVGDTPRIRLRIDGTAFSATAVGSAEEGFSSPTDASEVCVSPTRNFAGCPIGTRHVETLGDDASGAGLEASGGGGLLADGSSPPPIDPYATIEDLDRGVTVASGWSFYSRSSDTVLPNREELAILEARIAELQERIEKIEEIPAIGAWLRRFLERD